MSKVNIYQTINGKDELIETITKNEFNKRKDPSKYYMQTIKRQKDIEKYLEKNKDKLEIIKDEYIKNDSGNYNSIENFTTKKLTIKIIDKSVDLTNDKFITVIYNNIEYLANIDNFYKKENGYESEYKQEIYNILY